MRAELQGPLTSTAPCLRERDGRFLYKTEQGEEHPALGARRYGELSQAATDKLSHRYQCPWQPNPSIMDTEGSSSRGFIAWHMGDYEDTSQRNSKRAVLLRQSKAALPIGSRPPKPPKPPKLPKLPKKEEVVHLEIFGLHSAEA
ncbi:protein SPMIP2 [Ovis canadensis]|uniref:protein SPMIP2 n=1 Tax=Ovis canadensis TaxID=37174 RepID=UPI0038B4442D